MKKEYDFSKAVKGKFYRPKKVQKTIRLDESILNYFQNLSEKYAIPYQTLINLTLKKFIAEGREITLHL